ncbi:hypothetical protein ACIOJD_34405 [Streptomyces sp. NPDC088116]|uniref:hypothetical protein n=1 Tax=Streptomyces sp. NPDC088116 TaxID=3365825 RepID=UPI0037FB2D5A
MSQDQAVEQLRHPPSPDTQSRHVLRRWWLRARLYADPLPEEARAAVEAGQAPGRPAAAVVREAVVAREARGR